MPLFTPGFANPMTTGGDVIYGGTSGTPTRLANGSNGQVLTSSGGTSAPTWAPVSVTAGAVQTKTGTYTVLTTDATILVSNGPWTLTLYTPVGNTGKQVFVKKTDSSLTTGAVTIGTAAGNIEGNSTVPIYTTNESALFVSDGTNWQVVSHDIPSAWSSTTNTITGTTSNPTKGTIGIDKIWTRRVGANLEFRIEYSQTATGAAAAGSGDYLFQLVQSGINTSALTVNTTVGNANSQFTVGQGYIGFGTPVPCYAIPYDGANIRLKYITNASTSLMVSSVNYPITGATVLYTVTGSVPITNWGIF